MSISVGTLTAKLRADSAHFSRNMKAATTQVRGLEGGFAKGAQAATGLSRVMGPLGIALGTVAAGFATAAMAARHFAQEASKVEENVNVLNVVFGKNRALIEGWASEFGAAAQRSNAELQIMAGRLGAVLSGTVKSKDALRDMTTQLAQVAIDRASFFNTTDEDAITALRAGLVGETEPLRRLAVDLREDVLSAFASSQGLGGLKDLDQTQKMLLRYASILDQTRNSQGDAARTAGSYANTVKGLQAAFQDLSVSVGQKLLPAMTEMVGLLRMVVDGAKEAVEPISSVVKAIGGGIKAVGNSPFFSAVGKGFTQARINALQPAPFPTVEPDRDIIIRSTMKEIKRLGSVARAAASRMKRLGSLRSAASRIADRRTERQAMFGDAPDIDLGAVNDEWSNRAIPQIKPFKSDAPSFDAANAMLASQQTLAAKFEDFATVIEDTSPLFGNLQDRIEGTISQLAGPFAQVLNDTMEMFNAFSSSGRQNDELGGDILSGLISQSRAARVVASRVTDVFQAVSDIFGEVIIRLVPFLDVIGYLARALAPIVDAVMNILDPVLVLVFGAFKGFAASLTGIATIISEGIKFAMDFLTEKLANLLPDAFGGDALRNLITDAAGSWAEVAQRASDAASSVWDLDYGESIQRAREEMDGFSSALHGATENLPQGYKLAAARFGADVGEDARPGGDPVNPGARTPVYGDTSAVSGPTIHIGGDVNINVGAGTEDTDPFTLARTADTIVDEAGRWQNPELGGGG